MTKNGKTYYNYVSLKNVDDIKGVVKKIKDDICSIAIETDYRIFYCKELDEYLIITTPDYDEFLADSSLFDEIDISYTHGVTTISITENARKTINEAEDEGGGYYYASTVFFKKDISEIVNEMMEIYLACVDMEMVNRLVKYFDADLN